MKYKSLVREQKWLICRDLKNPETFNYLLHNIHRNIYNEFIIYCVIYIDNVLLILLAFG